ncbi:MAG: PAS domain S-box protein [Spirochaetes bacterium]|nr:PAS domain S-box protein [Spirochaetota bacterium]
MTAQENKTILLVEDDPISAMAESESISRFGYNVLVAGNGNEAVRITTGPAIVDLVLMDIDLGKGMDGTEAAKRILEKRNIPIVFLTAHGEREMVERVQGITRYGYVIKNSGDFVLQSSIEMALELFDAHQKISESEARQRTLVQTIPDLVWLKDADGVYLACNPRFEDFFGARESEIVGKTDYDFLNKELADFFRDHDRRAMAAGKPTVNEEWIRFASDGRRALLETIKTPMFGKDGKLIGVLGIGRDITERKNAEEALRSSERRMKAIVDGSPIPQFVVDKDHRVTHWNRALEEYSKIRAEDVIGTSDQWRAFYSKKRPCLADLIVDGKVDMIPGLYMDNYRKSQLVDNAYEAIDFFPAMKGGLWLQYTAAPIIDDDGEVVGAVETLNDITESKRAEESLRRSESNYRSVIENIQDVFYRSDAKGNLIMASPSWAHLLGYETLEECLGKPIAGTFYYIPEKRAEFLQCLRESGSVMNYEVVLKKKDGMPVTVETSSHFYYDSDGRIAGVEGIFRDITLRRQAEDALRINELRLKRAQEIAHVGNWEYNIQTGDFWGSDEAKRIYGFEIGQHAFSTDEVENCIPEKGRVHQALVDLVESGKEYNLEFEIYPLNSSKPRIITSIAELQPDEQSGQLKVVGVIQDITDRKRAEEALRFSENHLKAIVDGSPIPQFVIDREHRITHWNRALEEYSGIRSEDVIGTNQQWRAFYPYERPCMADLLVDGLTNRISQWYASKYSHSKLIKEAFEATDFFPAMRGGTWLFFTAAPIYGPDGAVIGAVETLSDVTDRMRAEDALKLNNLRLDTLLKVNQMTDAPVEDIMKYVFEEAVRLTKSEIGYMGRMNDDETEMEVLAWSRNVMPECRTGEKTLLFPVASAGLWAEAVRQHRPIVTNDFAAPNPWKKGYPEGHIVLKRHMNVPVMTGSKIALLVGVSNKAEDYDETDVRQLTLLMDGMLRIIERKKAEDSLRDSLAEKDVILKELYHRTKNNMQVICSMLNLRASDIKDAAAQDIYRDIQSKIQTMALVHQKLYDSQELSNLNLKEYADGIVDLMLSNNELSPGVVKIHRSVDAIPISIDTAMPLGLVLNELISNSMKHAFPDNRDGEIWIDMRSTDDGIKLEYRDNGIGLPLGYDPAKAQTLGMNIIRNLSRMQLGGDLHFMDDRGFGCTITMGTKLYRRRM